MTNSLSQIPLSIRPMTIALIMLVHVHAVDAEPNASTLLNQYNQARLAVHSYEATLLEKRVFTHALFTRDGAPLDPEAAAAIPPEEWVIVETPSWEQAPPDWMRIHRKVDAARFRVEYSRLSGPEDISSGPDLVYAFNGDVLYVLDNHRLEGRIEQGYTQYAVGVHQSPLFLSFEMAHGRYRLAEHVEGDYHIIEAGAEIEQIGPWSTRKLSLRRKQTGMVVCSIWLDLVAQGMPRKIEEYWERTGILRTRIDEIMIAPAEEGVWFPVSGRIRTYYCPDEAYSEELVMMQESLFSVESETLAVNEAIPDEAFTIDFPVGTLIHDYLEKRVYVAGNRESILDNRAREREHLLHRAVRFLAWLQRKAKGDTRGLD